MTPKIKQPAIDRLMATDVPEGPALDVLVANAVMEWEYIPFDGGGGAWDAGTGPSIKDLPRFSDSDSTAVRAVEAEIERRGLQETYVEALIIVVGGGDWRESDSAFWLLITATAEQRCRAALGAVRQELLDG